MSARNAWQKLGDMTREDAMERYIKLLSDSMPELMESHSYVSLLWSNIKLRVISRKHLFVCSFFWCWYKLYSRFRSLETVLVHISSQTVSYCCLIVLRNCTTFDFMYLSRCQTHLFQAKEWSMLLISDHISRTIQPVDWFMNHDSTFMNHDTSTKSGNFGFALLLSGFCDCDYLPFDIQKASF